MKLIESVISLVFIISFSVILMTFIIFMDKTDHMTMERNLAVTEYHNLIFCFYYYPDTFKDVLSDRYENNDIQGDEIIIIVDYKKTKLKFDLCYMKEEGNDYDTYTLNIKIYDSEGYEVFLPFKNGEKVVRKFK